MLNSRRDNGWTWSRINWLAESRRVSPLRMPKPSTRGQGQSYPSSFLTVINPCKFTSSQIWCTTVGSQGSTRYYSNVNKANKWLVKKILQDEQIDSMLKTTYFCGWMLVYIKQASKFRKNFIATFANFRFIVSGR